MSTSTPQQPQSAESRKEKDWSATQYSLFLAQRTRPVHDLISQLKPLVTTPNPRIYDLGCGPGNSTSALLSAFSGARVTGMDSSPDMLSKARAACPGAEFVEGDLSNFSIPASEAPDLLFSNAVFHWLRRPARIPALLRLFEPLASGSVLAIQVPDNYAEPSHAAMRSTAMLPSQPFSASFASARIGDVDCAARPDLDPIEPAADFYNALIPHAAHVDIWRTTYSHILDDAKAIVEWVKGTGLQPFLNEMESEEGKRAYLEKYEEVLKKEYPELKDGKVLLRYPRLFVVAVKK
ncbi:S-adenosyl-L-methionine-dependent methyltransferase [Phaeosphaeria sp. MPI-PUGE-AT-0046c]|nr:S-adenosyl-L-methionine-dependent methyltransferase [Phaeosphaeria sp. MPI-PUGE-AT-0046c]